MRKLKAVAFLAGGGEFTTLKRNVRSISADALLAVGEKALCEADVRGIRGKDGKGPKAVRKVVICGQFRRLKIVRGGASRNVCKRLGSSED